MYLFSEKTLSDDYSVWWCGSLTYLRTSNIFNQIDDYTSSDIIKIKEVLSIIFISYIEIIRNALFTNLP